MKKSIKKLIALLCAMTMLLSLVTIVAADAEQTYVWFEAENFKAGNLGTHYYAEASHDASSDVSVAYLNGAKELTDAYVEYDFDIAAEGEYDIWMLSINPEKNWLSSYTYQLDDEIGTETAHAVKSSGNPGLYNSLANNWPEWCKLNTVNLTADTHSLKINVFPRSSDGAYIAVIDCFIVVPKDWYWSPVDQYTRPSVGEASYVMLEAEAYANGNISTTSVSGNTLLHVFGNYAANGCYAEYKFNIAADDVYDVWVLGSTPAYKWQSDYTYTLDAGAPVYGYYSGKNIGDYNGGKYTFPQMYYIDGNRGDAGWHKMPTAEIKKGEHTLRLDFDPRSSDNAYWVAGVDKIAIVPSSWNWRPTTTNGLPYNNSNGTLWIEAEHYADKTTSDPAGYNFNLTLADNSAAVSTFTRGYASGSWFMNQYALTGTQEFTTAPDLTYKLKPQKSGNYDIYIISYRGTATHVSPLKYSIDGSDFAAIVSAPGFATSAAAAKVTTIYTWGRAAMQDLHMNKIPNVNLTSDKVHTLTLRSDEARSNNDMYVNAVDAMAIVPAGYAYTLPTAASESLMQAIVDFEAVGLADISNVTSDVTLPTLTPSGATITYATDVENVISENGTIVVPEAGWPIVDTTLTTTITKTENSVTGTATKAADLIVYPKVYATEAVVSYTNGTNEGSVINGTAMLMGNDAAQSAVVMIAYYDSANNLVTLSVVPVTGFEAGVAKEAPVSVTVPTGKAGGSAKMFVWNSLTGLRPIAISE